MKRLKSDFGNIRVVDKHQLQLLLRNLTALQNSNQLHLLPVLENFRRTISRYLVDSFEWGSTSPEARGLGSAMWKRVYDNLRKPTNEYIDSTEWIQTFYELFTEPDNPKLNLASGDTDEDE